MSRLCPNGHEVKDNLRFCPICGAELQEKVMKFCKKCGNERKGTEKFCPKCGTPFESMESPRQTQQYSPSYAETEDISNNQRYIIPIIIGVAILALIGGGWWYYNSSKTTDSKNDIAATDTIAADTVAADVTPKQQVKNIYMNLISENNASQYYLADLSGDGVPELLLKKCLTSSCFIDIYTVYNNKTIQLLGIGGDDDNFYIYIGKNYIIVLRAGDDYCVWSKYAYKKYEETSMVEDVIYKGYLEENENFYKEPTEPLLDWNDISNKELFTQWNMQ